MTKHKRLPPGAKMYPLRDRAGWTLKFYDSGGKRREHRIPSKYIRRDDAERYAIAWLDEQVRLQGERTKQAVEAQATGGMTFKQLGTLWTSGDLARRYPDRIKIKQSADDDEARLRLHVYAVVGHISVKEFSGSRGLDLADEVLAALPKEHSSQTRRHIAQAVHRLLTIAAYPMREITASPLPKGWLPRVEVTAARTHLYPDEDRRLLGAVSIPLVYRFLYGFLAREGLRAGEALALERRDLDLERGALVLDRNKTHDPRSWKLSPGVARACAIWFDKIRPTMGARSTIFTEDDGEPIDRYELAERLREHLKLAGVAREVLFERSDTRRPIRVHDLRATFVTTALANDRTEAWVSARTGHRSSQMIARYRRIAQSVAELTLGDLDALDAAIPEFRKDDPVS